MLTIDEILAKMRANYDPVVKALPGDLREEFQTRVLPLTELEELAPFFHTSSEFEGRAAIGLTQRKIGRKVTVMSFNKKLIAAGIRTDDVYGGLFSFRVKYPAACGASFKVFGSPDNQPLAAGSMSLKGCFIFD